MKYEAVVYFASPRTQWAGKVHEEDVIARRPHRWRWLALLDARSTHARLDSARCGYAVLGDGNLLESIEAAPDLGRQVKPGRESGLVCRRVPTTPRRPGDGSVAR